MSPGRGPDFGKRQELCFLGRKCFTFLGNCTEFCVFLLKEDVNIFFLEIENTTVDERIVSLILFCDSKIFKANMVQYR